VLAILYVATRESVVNAARAGRSPFLIILMYYVITREVEVDPYVWGPDVVIVLVRLLRAALIQECDGRSLLY
jgi:hypothetical protein